MLYTGSRSIAAQKFSQFVLISSPVARQIDRSAHFIGLAMISPPPPPLSLL